MECVRVRQADQIVALWWGETFPRVQAADDWGPLSQGSTGVERGRHEASGTVLKVCAVMVTPQKAEKLLDDRAPNRSVSSTVLNKMLAIRRWDGGG